MKAHHIILLSLVALIAMALGACSQATPTPEPTPTPIGDAAAGATSFTGTCSSCHGTDAKGLPGLGKDLTTSEFVKGKTDLELVDFVLQGRPSSDPANTTGIDMPPKGGNPALSDQDIANIVVYLRTIAQQQ